MLNISFCLHTPACRISFWAFWCIVHVRVQLIVMSFVYWTKMLTLNPYLIRRRALLVSQSSYYFSNSSCNNCYVQWIEETLICFRYQVMVLCAEFHKILSQTTNNTVRLWFFSLVWSRLRFPLHRTAPPTFFCANHGACLAHTWVWIKCSHLSKRTKFKLQTN